MESGIAAGRSAGSGGMECDKPAERRCVDLLSIVGDMGGVAIRQTRARASFADSSRRRRRRAHRGRVAQPYETAGSNRARCSPTRSWRRLFILAAAWLVWTRPGAMTWGFFPLCDLVQLRTGFRLLRLPAGAAAPAAGAGSGGRGDPGRRLRGVPAVRAAGAFEPHQSRLGAAGLLCCRWWRSCSSGCRLRAMRMSSGIPTETRPGRRSSPDLGSMRRRS